MKSLSLAHMLFRNKRKLPSCILGSAEKRLHLRLRSSGVEGS